MGARRRTPDGLLWLNAALLVALGAVALSPAASAQRASRSQGEFALLAANVQGLSGQGVYIIDADNHEIAAFYWDQSRKLLTPMGYRDMDQDMRRAEGGSR